jgi:hypothetical protein
MDKLLVELGAACLNYQDRALRNLNCNRVQIDECWAFCCAKQKNVTEVIAAKPCRLASAFSRKIEEHSAAVALHLN